MEELYMYKIMYSNIQICTLSAHSVWEAIEKAYSRYAPDVPNLDRTRFFAIKVR